jgi:hypothetical protein
MYLRGGRGTCNEPQICPQESDPESYCPLPPYLNAIAPCFSHSSILSALEVLIAIYTPHSYSNINTNISNHNPHALSVAYLLPLFSAHYDYLSKRFHCGL